MYIRSRLGNYGGLFGLPPPLAPAPTPTPAPVPLSPAPAPAPTPAPAPAPTQIPIHIGYGYPYNQPYGYRPQYPDYRRSEPRVIVVDRSSKSQKFGGVHFPTLLAILAVAVLLKKL